MAQIYGNWLKYLRNGFDLWELTQRSWEISKIFGKWLKNGLKCGKLIRDLGNGQNIWEMAQIHGARLKYLRNGLTMLEMV